LAFGLVAEQAGARGVTAVHVALGLGAIAALLLAATRRPAKAALVPSTGLR